MATWHTKESIRAAWSEASRFSDEQLAEAIETAKFDITAIGPQLDDPNVPTQGFREAQLLAVKAVFASRKGNAGSENGEAGLEGFQVRRAHYRRSTDIMTLLYPERDWIA
ncbi:hypothetical protein M2152_001998 [Microbacteriaceae bacterium SG_E_30_P1]|uniref:Uncharacterized protein n=1 Tax=Antiquaquibacter oligotrophicus TaxID=2880260 RepID=A0ABT6KP94_9MICO|nr:hypothetical protein [Antiquaquibacter oligotrophicus]MDH6181816.1 hypothetical protein [Antiquaquibacter oligotrophicus]UDF12505.1 hypothetical protein LH407_10115 [Antiquaquibacter oligotrophicus]